MSVSQDLINHMNATSFLAPRRFRDLTRGSFVRRSFRLLKDICDLFEYAALRMSKSIVSSFAYLVACECAHYIGFSENYENGRTDS